MQIYNAIDTWCKADNAKKPLKRIAVVTIGLFLSLVLIASLTNNMIWFALAVVVVFLWALYAPKGRSAKSFMVTPTLRRASVPDDLLMHLADDPDIPGWIKGKIATALHSTKRIYFDFLFSLDDDLSMMKDFDKLEAGQGFKAITAFSHTPKSWGLPDDIVFRVTRGGQTSPTPCSFDQMLEFLNACGLDPSRDEAQVAGIIAGAPFEIDGATTRFEQVRINGANIDWAIHAHPLKQISITLQGTRHSEPEIMLEQLDEIVGRIKRGDTKGESSDDDFGYKFSVALRSDSPSIFGNTPAT